MNRAPYIHLLTSDDPDSGIVARQDVVTLTQIALRVVDRCPVEAQQLLDIARSIRATIPSTAWESVELNFPMADPSIGLEVVD